MRCSPQPAFFLFCVSDMRRGWVAPFQLLTRKLLWGAMQKHVELHIMPHGACGDRFISGGRGSQCRNDGAHMYMLMPLKTHLTMNVCGHRKRMRRPATCMTCSEKPSSCLLTLGSSRSEQALLSGICTHSGPQAHMLAVWGQDGARQAYVRILGVGAGEHRCLVQNRNARPLC